MFAGEKNVVRAQERDRVRNGVAGKFWAPHVSAVQTKMI